MQMRRGNKLDSGRGPGTQDNAAGTRWIIIPRLRLDNGTLESQFL